MGNHFRGVRLAAAYCLVAVTGSSGAVVLDRPVAVAGTAQGAQAAQSPSMSAGAALTRGGPECVSVVDGRAGTWTRRPVPAFPVGEAALVGHAVDHTSPERQLVTNGHVILATADGCSWQETWRLPASPTARMPVNATTDRVLEVAVHPSAPRRVWAVVALGQDVAERVPLSLPLSPAAAEGRDPTSAIVLRSVDGGETWKPMGTPPLAGTPGRLALSASDPDLLFLPTATGLHASRDGGQTWQLLPAAVTGPVRGRRPLDGVSVPVLASVLVDPQDPSHLFGRTSTPVHSRDGGLTWSAYPTPAGFWTGPFPGADGAWFARQEFSTSPVLDLWHGEENLVSVPAEMDGSPWRAAPGSQGGMLLATWDRSNGAAFPEVSLYGVADDGKVTDVNDLGLPWVRGVIADDYGGHHLHTRTELVSLGPMLVGREPRRKQVRLHPFGTTTPEPPRPAFLDAPTLLPVDPEQNRPLEVLLDLPRRPTPLDTYFLIDTSNSFEPDIQAVAAAMADVVTSVRKAGIDAWFGVGELGTRDARRYRRLAELEAPGIGLQRGFERLRTGGSQESHLIALHQAATGSGVAGTSGPAVPAGQDPTWRVGTLRTVVVVTDVQYSDEDDPEARSRREVYDALAARGVRVIGLEVVREGGDDGVPGGYAAVEAADAASTTAPTPARADLEELARETGSFAPPGGIDCRDNGTVEIRAGDPLVCTTTALHVGKLHTIGDVLRRVLLAQVDLRRVRVAVDGEPLATPAAGWRARVDVRRDQRLPFAGSVSCAPDQAGQIMPLRLTATLDGEPLSRAVVQVACGRTAAPPMSQNPPPPEQQTPPGTFEPPPGPPALATAPPPPVLPAPVGGVAPGTSAAASSTAPGAASGSAGGTAPAASAVTAPGTAAGQASGPQSATAPVGLTTGASQDDAELATVRLLCAGLLTSAVTLSLQRRRSRQLRLTRNHS